jgi:hypothetical protein
MYSTLLSYFYQNNLNLFLFQFIIILKIRLLIPFLFYKIDEFYYYLSKSNFFLKFINFLVYSYLKIKLKRF